MNVPRRWAAVLLTAVLATGCADGSPPKTLPRRTGTPGPATIHVEVDGDVRAAAPVLRKRLEGMALTPSEPVVEGSTVTFQVKRAPSQPEVAALSRRGRLEFRRVVTELAPGAPVPGVEGEPEGDCADVMFRGEMAKSAAAAGQAETVVCAVDGSAKYRVEAPLDHGEVASAEGGIQPDSNGVETGEPVITVRLRDAAAWQALTARLVGQQVAILLDGLAHAAPQVESAIPDGTVQITGFFREPEAKLLAAVVASGRLDAKIVVRRG